MLAAVGMSPREAPAGRPPALQGSGPASGSPTSGWASRSLSMRWIIWARSARLFTWPRSPTSANLPVSYGPFARPSCRMLTRWGAALALANVPSDARPPRVCGGQRRRLRRRLDQICLNSAVPIPGPAGRQGHGGSSRSHVSGWSPMAGNGHGGWLRATPGSQPGSARRLDCQRVVP